MARDNRYSEAIAGELLERLMNGESLRGICKDDHMPYAPAIFKWINDPKHADFKEKYILARQVQAEMFADELVSLSDDCIEDDAVRVARSKLKIATRQWTISKVLPNKYGDKTTTELVGKDGSPAFTINITQAESQLC